MAAANSESQSQPDSKRDEYRGEFRGEFRDDVASIGPESLVPESVRRLFVAIDRDGNGQLTRAEIIRTVRDATRTNNVALLSQLKEGLGLTGTITQEGESHAIFERVFQVSILVVVLLVIVVHVQYVPG